MHKEKYIYITMEDNVLLKIIAEEQQSNALLVVVL